MTQLRVSGHGLQSEGKPYRLTMAGELVKTSEKSGAALCSCGMISPWFDTNAARRRWHRAHKQAVLGEVSDRPFDPNNLDHVVGEITDRHMEAAVRELEQLDAPYDAVLDSLESRSSLAGYWFRHYGQKDSR